MMRMAYIAAALSTLLGASACATATPTTHSLSPDPVAMVSGSRPFINQSPLANGFQCLREDLAATGLSARIAVGEVTDKTGKFSYEATQGGSTVSQGTDWMVMSALGNLGPNVRQIQRRDMKIAEVEQALTERRLLGDPAPAGTGAEVVERPLRGHLSAVYNGTDYYISGAVTEINYNIRSGGIEFEVGQIGAGRRSFVMDVTVDLMITQTTSLEVVKTVTVRKQIIGYETKAGVFSFFGGDYLFDLNMGSQNQEPIQLGVRSALEMAVMELVPNVFGTSFDRCRDYTNATYS